MSNECDFTLFTTPIYLYLHISLRVRIHHGSHPFTRILKHSFYFKPKIYVKININKRKITGLHVNKKTLRVDIVLCGAKKQHFDPEDQPYTYLF